jgi:hypothetical protein
MLGHATLLSPEGRRRMFDYDRTIPLQVQESSAEKRGAAIVHDLSYASPTLGRVSAYLTEPAEKSRCPAIIFLHWGQGDRATFLSEALAYAESGVESLLVDESPLRHFPMPNQMTSDGARAYVVQCVTDLRRGVDLSYRAKRSIRTESDTSVTVLGQVWVGSSPGWRSASWRTF